MYPLISIIVPVYNVEKYLSKCLESIINQTYKNLEIILVDDGSTDKSGIICDKYIEKDNRIRIIHKNNGGLSDARNKGLDMAKGEYVGFVDSDDFIAEDMYECLYNFAQKNNLDVAMCSSCDVYENKVIYPRKFRNIILDEKEAIINNIFLNPFGGTSVSVCNKLFTIDVVRDIRFEKDKTTEDGFFVLQWIGKVKRFGRIDKVKYFYRQRDKSIIHQRRYNNKILDVIDAYQRNLEIISLKYPKSIKSAEFRLWWAYKSAIERIIYCEDAFKYKTIIKFLQLVIRKNLIKIFKNSNIKFKVKMSYLLLSFNFKIYFFVKNLMKG